MKEKLHPVVPKHLRPISDRVETAILSEFDIDEKITLTKEDFLKAYEGLKELLAPVGCKINFK